MIYTWICAMLATLAVNTIFVFTLLAMLTGEQRAIFLFATLVLSGGLIFTFRAMQRLTR